MVRDESKKRCSVQFVIGKRPFCFWDAEILDINRQFLLDLDPNYFSFLADLYWGILSADEDGSDPKSRQYAAVGLRTAYSQGLEVFFSLLFASIQAPNCVFGWLSNYTNKDLFECVESIRNYKKILSRYQGTVIRTWADIAELIHYPLTETHPEEAAQMIKNFELLCSNFACDFVDPLFTREYNCIKHALRVKMGGYYVAIGAQPDLGTPAPPESMVPVTSSEFGTTFFGPEQIRRTPNYVINRTSRNWFPENYFRALKLVSQSISNVLQFALLGADAPQSEFIYICEDISSDEESLQLGSGPTMTRSSQIIKDRVPVRTADDIIKSYEMEA
ncbi:MAG: hypothetical protein IT172_11455 [Acidobacteria bacterium]|nr:hypothetical protein [Acidobacteriota bacterium]